MRILPQREIRSRQKDSCYRFRELLLVRSNNSGIENGVECSSSRLQNKQQLDRFLEMVNIVPFSEGIDVFSKEKARLRKCGTPVEDFDLFIGCTAVSKGMTLITDNIKHFERINDLNVQNWVTR